MNNMDSIKCQALLLAIQHGSLTAAGKELGYTQSGITRMIQSLEEEIGFPLLVRNNQGVQPSANGRQMMPVFQEVVRASQKAVDLGAAIQGVLAGVLNVGCYYSIAAAWMPKILSKFQELYPNVSVHLMEGTNKELAQWLDEKTIDCCLSAKFGNDVTYDWIPLYEDELVVWLPPDHPWTEEESITLAHLDDAPFVIPLPNRDTDIDRFLAANFLEPDIRFTTSDPYTAYCMVEEGLGISLNNRLTTKRWNGRVVLRPFEPAQHISLGIAVPDIQELSPATSKFIAQVWQTVQGETAQDKNAGEQPTGETEK